MAKRKEQKTKKSTLASSRPSPPWFCVCFVIFGHGFVFVLLFLVLVEQNAKNVSQVVAISCRSFCVLA